MTPYSGGPAADSAYAVLNIIDFLCLGAGIYLLLVLHDRKQRAGYLLLAFGLALLALRMVPDYLFHGQPGLYQAALTLSMAMAGVLICWGTLSLTATDPDGEGHTRLGRALLWGAAAVALIVTVFVWLLPFWPSLRAAILAASSADAFQMFQQGLRVAIAAALLACAWITWERRPLGGVVSRMFGAAYFLWAISVLLTATRTLPGETTFWTAHIVRVLGTILIGNALAAHVYRAERLAIERQQRLALIDSVASAAIAAPRLEPMVSAATDRVRELLGAAWAATYLRSADGARLVVSHRTEPALGLPDEVDASSDHPVSRAAQQQEPVRFTHEPPESDPSSGGADDTLHAVALPLAGLEGLVGVLVMGMADGQRLSDADVDTLSNAAGHLGIIIQHMLLLEHVRLAGDRWRQTFDAITELVTVHDREGRIVAANAAAQRFAGKSEGEMTGLLLGEAFPAATEAEAAVLHDMLVACFESGSVPGTRMHRIRGRVHQIQVMPLRDDEGIVFGCVRVARDVTSRWRAEERLAQSERRYRELAENANDAIYTHDLDGNFLYVNHAAVKILGYTREQFSHLCFWDVVTPESQSAARAYVRDLLAEEARNEQVELRFLCADGRVIVVQLRANVLRRAGRAEAIHGIARDVTAEKELGAQLIQADRLASVGTLIAGVAHELNNPLTTIAGYAEMLKARFAGTDEADTMRTIAVEAERCRHVARNLLNFARQTDDRMISFSMNDLVRAVLNLRAYDLRASDIEVVTTLGDLPDVFADYGQLQQVVYNLVDNAYYALREQGGGTLSVSTVAGDGQVRVCVADNGPGIPPRLAGRVFEPFFTTKPRDQGTGLGLNICRRIVEDHGGAIEYEDAQPGARFTMTLPATAALSAETDCRGPEDDLPAVPASESRVLFIDDEPALCTLVSEYLGRLGHPVNIAASGEEGLEAALGGDFDVIICDMRLPGMSGEEVCEALLERRPEIARRLIVATGDILSPRTQEFFDRTGLPHIHKPFRLDELADIVADLTSTRDDEQPPG